jgi:hypothetical protein
MEKEDILKRRFMKTETVVFRKIGDECILVPISRRAEDINYFYTLNEVAARIWDNLDGSTTGEDTRDRILQEWEVDPQTAEDDLVEFLQQLLSIGALKEVVHGMPVSADSPGI